MTLDELRQLLGALPAHSIRTDGSTAAAVLRTLEDLADARPADRHLAKAVHAVAAWTSAPRGLPVTIGGVRREQLVRWDGWTTTWEGADVDEGSQAMIRVLRPFAASDPVKRRQLTREARALEALVPGATRVAGDLPGIRAPLPGEPLTASNETADEDALHTRLLATGLVAISAWEEREMSLPPLTREELRNCGNHLALVCLTPDDGQDQGHVLTRIASLLGYHEATSLGELRLALSLAPPSSAADAEKYAISAMAQDLAARRHDLFLRHIRGRHRDRVARFHLLALRLQESMPAPQGTGAVGVDLDGGVQIVRSGDDGIFWGPLGAAKRIFSTEKGFVAPEARRLLRTRAASPNNERLQQQVGGDSAFTEAIGQWVAAALKLRTVRMLLERSL